MALTMSSGGKAADAHSLEEEDEDGVKLMNRRNHATPPPIDIARNRFPFCVVFQPFPPLTFIFPFIGHTGICDSRGVVWDFQGPFTIVDDSMMLGKATRYLPLDPEKVFTEVDGATTAAECWDECVRRGNDVYRKRIHCIIYPNCNHHVAHCLNEMRYGGWRYYEMLQLWFLIFFRAKFCGTRGFLVTFGPLIAILFFLAFWYFGR